MVLFSSVLNIDSVTNLVTDSINSSVVHWTRMNMRPCQTDLLGMVTQFTGLIIAFHKGRCHFPFSARKSAWSIFLQISEHACHSLLIPVKSSYEIFYREICKYFDCLCHSFRLICRLYMDLYMEWKDKNKQKILM